MNTKFKLGEKVYHITPDSPRGIVVNIKYMFVERLFLYQVAFCEDKEALWYYEHEISTNKTF
jgi:hypothetical protein